MESQGLGKAFHGGEHYENFPVGSWLVPKPMRKAVLALYRFARTGDDLADEGELSVEERLSGLEALQEGLERRHCEEPEGRRGNLASIGAALREELDAHGVPTAPAEALLSAFRQDVHNPILQTEDDVLDYCSRSANPIGQLVLAFAGLADLKADECALIRKSNAICTGLQLANFAQDMGQDFSRGRIYVPQSWGEDEPVTKMARWAQEHLAQGEGLPRRIRQHPSHSSFRLALEIALTLEGGNAICKKVLKQPAAVWEKSPSLSKKDLPVLLLRSLTRL
jgi:hydroxysqualene synthase